MFGLKPRRELTAIQAENARLKANDAAMQQQLANVRQRGQRGMAGAPENRPASLSAR